MSRGRFAAALAVCVASLTIAACGEDEDSGGGVEDFIADVESYCVERSQASVDALEPLGGPRAPADLSEQIAQTEATGPVAQETAEGLDDFDAPAELEAKWDEFVSLRQQAADIAGEALAAAEANDDRAYQQALEENGELREEANAIAAEMGFTACAGELSDEDEAAVSAVVEDVATTADPAQCTEVFTESYLENNFGKEFGDESDDPLTACEQYQDELGPGDLAKSVEIRSVLGPEPQASVEVVEVGGANADRPTQWRLVKEDDVWKVNDIAVVSGG